MAGQVLAHEGEDIMLITDAGTIIRTTVDDIPTHGRSTMGVRLMKVNDNARIVSVERVEREPEVPDEPLDKELSINDALKDAGSGNEDL